MASDKKDIERKLEEAEVKRLKLEEEIASLSLKIDPLSMQRDVALRNLKSAKARIAKLTELLNE